MNQLEHTTLVSKVLIKHLEFRKKETNSAFIWVKFDTRAFDERVLNKRQWLKHIKAVAASCGCKYVNHFLTDYDMKIMYFFANPSHVLKTAMEQLQEASYAR